MGRWVEYRPSAGNIELGWIKRWDKFVIFVVYKCSGAWDDYMNYTAAATNPKELNFVEEYKEKKR